jgi:hypothetical protein
MRWRFEADCAGAGEDHAAAASPAMNSRRRMRSPRLVQRTQATATRFGRKPTKEDWALFALDQIEGRQSEGRGEGVAGAQDVRVWSSSPEGSLAFVAIGLSRPRGFYVARATQF